MLFLAFGFMSVEISQYGLSEQWVPPPPSSCTQSEHRSGTAAQPGPYSDASSGCPVMTQQQI